MRGDGNWNFVQRVSERIKWSVTLDNAADKPLGASRTTANFAYDPPNDGGGANEIKVHVAPIDVSGFNLPAPNITNVVTQNWDLYPGALTDAIQIIGSGPLVGVPYLYSNGVALAPTYYAQLNYKTIEVRYKIPANAIVGANATIIMKTNVNDQFEYDLRLFEVKQRP